MVSSFYAAGSVPQLCQLGFDSPLTDLLISGNYLTGNLNMGWCNNLIFIDAMVSLRLHACRSDSSFVHRCPQGCLAAYIPPHAVSSLVRSCHTHAHVLLMEAWALLHGLMGYYYL